MAFIWYPRVYKNSAFTNLPRPITQLRMPFLWDFARHKVPLLDGVTTEGHSLNDVEVQIAGHIGKVGSTKKITEELMWTSIEALKTALDVSSGSDKFEFFWYYDAGTTTYRKLKSCICTRFDVDIGDDERVIFPYTITLLAEDPVIYTTAEGA